MSIAPDACLSADRKSGVALKAHFTTLKGLNFARFNPFRVVKDEHINPGFHPGLFMLNPFRIINLAE
jgi:hypothetical protein